MNQSERNCKFLFGLIRRSVPKLDHLLRRLLENSGTHKTGPNVTVFDSLGTNRNNNVSKQNGLGHVLDNTRLHSTLIFHYVI